MSEYWEPIYARAMATCAVWNEFDADFMVGRLTLSAHQADTGLFTTRVKARGEAEDDYDQAVDAKDANLRFLAGMNTRAVGVIRGNLEEGDPLHVELDDLGGMKNEGGGRILARVRKLTALWVKVNALRAAMTPPLPELSVGTATVASVETATAGHEPLLKAVAERLSAWSTARGAVRTLAAKVDKNNKRWFEAWSNFYDAGSPEHEALAQIGTGSGPNGG